MWNTGAGRRAPVVFAPQALEVAKATASLKAKPPDVAVRSPAPRLSRTQTPRRGPGAIRGPDAVPGALPGLNGAQKRRRRCRPCSLSPIPSAARKGGAQKAIAQSAQLLGRLEIETYTALISIAKPLSAPIRSKTARVSGPQEG